MVPIDTIAAYLKEAGAPVPVRKIEKDLRGDVSAALLQAEQSGLVFPWPKYRRAQRYWHRESGAVIREQMLAIAGETAMPKAGLIRATAKRAHNCGSQAAETVAAALVKEGAIKKARTVGLTALFYKADTPQSLVSASYAALADRLRQLEIDLPAISSLPPVAATAVSVAALPDRVLEAAARLQPAPGVPITVQSLRAAVPDASKQDFDAAVLALADRQAIYLTTHDHGWALPETERDQLVWDGGQKLYVAVTLRN